MKAVLFILSVSLFIHVISFEMACLTNNVNSDQCTSYGTHTWSNGVCYYCSDMTSDYYCSSISQSNNLCTCSNCAAITTALPTKTPITRSPSHPSTTSIPSGYSTNRPTSYPTHTGTVYCSTRDTTDIKKCQWNSKETAAIINGVCYYCKGVCTLTQTSINGYEQCVCTDCKNNPDNNSSSSTGITVGSVFGLVAVIIIICVIFYFYKKKKAGTYPELYSSLNEE